VKARNNQTATITIVIPMSNAKKSIMPLFAEL
jgi:hypothetical protein